jgi:predicted transglutaminase-like cysteine proteinase
LLTTIQRISLQIEWTKGCFTQAGDYGEPEKGSIMIRILMLFASAALAVSCFETGAATLSKTGTTMQMRGHAFAPPAFKLFCAKQGALCSTRGSTKVIELTSARKRQLSAVNSFVNSHVAERSDLQSTGKMDEWDLPKSQGDCEDFAILKKSELVKRGWPASALLLTVARSGGEGHTVLTVRTNEGDLVLDNMTSAIRDWSRTPYRYFARQSQSDGRTWERIGSAKQL